MQPGHDTVQPGSVLGPYEIVELLGAGGMGAVYRARDTRLDREVALKIILPDSTSESTHRRRFLNEAKAVSALNHPNVVTVYEAASIDGVDFIAMELILGETLSARIGRGAIPIPDAVRLALQVAEGLSAAHQSGLVHRDLKPSNIMLTRDGRVKILDFGLAKKTQHTTPATASATLSMLTAAGSAVGTLAYMSPEQARGDIPGPLSDMFTYGTVLYEALTCLRPFDGRTQLDYFHQLCYEDPVPLSTRRPETPPALIAIVTRAMARNPSDRFASMASLVDVLKVLVMSDAQLAFASSTATMTTLPRYTATGQFSTRANAWRKYSQAGLATIATVAVAVAVYYFARRPFAIPAAPATLTKVTYDAGLTGYPGDFFRTVNCSPTPPIAPEEISISGSSNWAAASRRGLPKTQPTITSLPSRPTVRTSRIAPIAVVVASTSRRRFPAPRNSSPPEASTRSIRPTEERSRTGAVMWEAPSIRRPHKLCWCLCGPASQSLFGPILKPPPIPSGSRIRACFSSGASATKPAMP